MRGGNKFESKYDENRADKENIKITYHNICQNRQEPVEIDKISKKVTMADEPLQKKRTSTRVRKSSFLDHLKENYY